MARNTSFNLLSSPGWLFGGIPILMFLALSCLLLGGALGSYLVMSQGLEPPPDLTKFQYKAVTTIRAADGSVLGTYYTERRYPVPLSRVSKNLVNAFIAAEDARFYQHPGIDFNGVLRAAVRNIQRRDFAQGGSTITQQLVRNIMLTREKTIFRKMREMILAVQFERLFSKDLILQVYLNQIYLGRGAYGVEAAAQTFFGKPASDVTLPEAAMIAALTSNPSNFSLTSHYADWKKKQRAVLGAMLKNRLISKSEYEAALNAQPDIRDRSLSDPTRFPYFTEAVRSYVTGTYGADTFYNNGLEILTTMDPTLQAEAEEAVLQGGKSWEKREGRPSGLVKRLKKSELADFLKAKVSLTPGTYISAVVLKARPASKKHRKRHGKVYEVTLMTPGKKTVWALLETAVPYARNDVVNLKVLEVTPEGKIKVAQDPTPAAQGALVSIENATGYVRAIVGGAGYEKSNFNRATQALRQPGSAFKPVVYAAGLEWGGYSPRTALVDEPIAVTIGSTDEEWIPTNSDNRFIGRTTLRNALVQSRNIVAVKLLMDVGIKRAVDMARQMGMQSPIKSHLSVALGSSEVTPYELTAAYTIFPNMGIRVRPTMILKIFDRMGKLYENNTMQPLGVEDRVRFQPLADYCLPNASDNSRGEKKDVHLIAGSLSGDLERFCSVFQNDAGRVSPAMSPQTAYLMVSMLREVTVSGTASAAAKLRRSDIGGKTGTTDDATDAWFVGFNPKYTTGVWFGYDTRTSLGEHEAGSTAALPIWIDYMSAALAHEPMGVYPVPPGISFHQTKKPERVPNNKLLVSQPDYEADHETKKFSPIDAVILSSRPEKQEPVQTAGANPYAPSYIPAVGASQPAVKNMSAVPKHAGPARAQ